MKLKEKEKPYEDIYSNRLFRWVGNGMADLVVNTRITPEILTFLNIIFELFAAVLFFMGNYLFLILGSLAMFLAQGLDYADGTLARRKSLSSRYGEWLDETGDKLVEPFVFLGIILGQYFINYHGHLWFWGSIAIGVRMGTIILVANTERFMGKDRKFLKTEVSKNVLTRLCVFNKSSMVILMVFFSLINNMHWFLIIVSVYGLFFNIASFLYIRKKMKKEGLDRTIV